jgi:hypothetical protein
MLLIFKGFCYGIEGMWLCYEYLRGVVMLWVFKGCGHVMGIKVVWLCYGNLRGVVMLWVIKGCGYVMGN